MLVGRLWTAGGSRFLVCKVWKVHPTQREHLGGIWTWAGNLLNPLLGIDLRKQVISRKFSSCSYFFSIICPPNELNNLPSAAHFKVLTLYDRSRLPIV